MWCYLALYLGGSSLRLLRTKTRSLPLRIHSESSMSSGSAEGSTTNSKKNVDILFLCSYLELMDEKK